MSFTRDDSTEARRLHRAQLIASVGHPNLVRLVPRSGGGYSPALDGAQRLSHFSGSSAPFRCFELEHAVRLLLDVLNGLGALHDLLIDGEPFVHGCVSPEHICVDAHGQARLSPLARPHFTPEGASELNGYAAPEWLLGSQVDQRADLFSVGVLLWEALAGRRLFPEPSPAVVLARLASGALPRPALRAGADWARGLCLVAERALAAEPADRPMTARELSGAIVAAAGPRLTRPLSDAWHDEAPTLPPQPRPQPALRRTFTPPGVAIDLSPEVKLESTPPVAPLPLAPVAAPPLFVAALAPKAPSTGLPLSSPALSSPALSSSALSSPPRASLRPWLLGVAAATYLALMGWLHAQRDAAPLGVQPATALVAAPPSPSLATTAVAAHAPAPAAAHARPPALLIRPALAVSAGSPAATPSAAPATSSAPSRSLRAAPAQRRMASPAPPSVDYGI